MRRLFILLVIILMVRQASAQLLPPNQPEQDACYALSLCGDIFYSPYSYQGVGRVMELASTPCGGAENNSMWLKVEVISAGSIVFTIKPVNPLDDYDFSIVNFTGKNCQETSDGRQVTQLTTSDVVRCNYNNNQVNNNGYIGPEVGLNSTSQLQFVAAGTTGSNFLQQIDASSGDVFLILINNWGTGGGPSSGFSIDFRGSTAEFRKDPPPLYDSLHAACNEDVIEVLINSMVDCQSIAADGTDFAIEPQGIADVLSAEGVDCSGNDGYTDRIRLRLNRDLPSGSYTLRPRTGSDGNTLLNACKVAQPLSDRILFAINAPTLKLPPDTITCAGNTIQLNAEIDGVNGDYNIRWSPSDYLDNANIANPLCTPTDDITYTVRVWASDHPECFEEKKIHVSVLKGFDLISNDTLICLGASLHLRADGDQRYAYSWAPAVDGNPFNAEVTPDSTTVYTLTAAYPGCEDSVRSLTVEVDRSILHASVYLETDKKRFCVGESVFLRPVVDSAALYLSWSFDGQEYERLSGPQQHAFSRPGAIPIAVTSHYRACPDITHLDTFLVSPPPVVVLGKDTSICFNGTPLLLTNQYDDTLSVGYLWNTGDTTAALKVTHPGTYTLTQASMEGCATTESITVSKGCYMDIPNAFTPGDDGENNYFFPRQLLTKNITRFKMRIRNRWGQLLFETDTVNGRGWDGNFNGKEQPAGVYIYLIDAEIDGSRVEHYSGNVTLLR